MNYLYNLAVEFANWAWGIPMLVVVVVGGILLTIRLGAVQFVHFGKSLKFCLGNMFKSGDEDGISGFQAVATALAGTVGTGNIVGVSMAIAYGGPGAVFWMWIAGLFAMCIKYSEVLASMIYRERRPDGEYSAGPYMYLQHLFKNKTISKIIAVTFAIFLFIALFIAAGVHTGATVDTMENVGVPRMITTIVVIAITAIIVYGGVNSVVKFTEKLVPFMSILYIIGGTIIIIMNAGNLIPTIISIFQHAFQPTAAVGGFVGSTIMLTIRWGIARGIYSNDAGNGIASIVHGQSNADHPVEQAMWGIFEVFFDTIIICTFTALSILASGAWIKYGPADEFSTLLTHKAFTDSLGGVGTAIITAALVLFAFSTALSFAYLIENQASSLLGKTTGKIFQVAFFGMMFVGATVGVRKIILMADVTNALSIFINMIALIMMSGVLKKYTDDYFSGEKIYNRKENM